VARKPRAPTYEECVEEEAFTQALERYFRTHTLEEWLRQGDPLRMSRDDFVDDDQAVEWRRALQELADKDNPSVEGVHRLMRLGKPLSGRLGAAIAYLLRGGVVIPVKSDQAQDPDIAPETLAEVVVQPWPAPTVRKKPPHRPTDPASWDKAQVAAVEVIRRKAEERHTSWTIITEEVANEHHVSPKRVRAALETFKEFNQDK
jgi:hypothetical protein